MYVYIIIFMVKKNTAPPNLIETNGRRTEVSLLANIFLWPHGLFNEIGFSLRRVAKPIQRQCTHTVRVRRGRRRCGCGRRRRQPGQAVKLVFFKLLPSYIISYICIKWLFGKVEFFFCRRLSRFSVLLYFASVWRRAISFCLRKGCLIFLYIKEGCCSAQRLEKKIDEKVTIYTYIFVWW